MFRSDPILWLQSWASPPLTAAMDFISWFGYTRAAVAILTLMAFTYRLRPALAILLLTALNATATDAAKALVASPRPYLADPRVVALGSFVPSDAADSDSGFGFPSGHVGTVTTVFLGTLMLLKWRAAWWLLLCGVPLMALSRLYLGRHYLGDLLGAVLIGVATTFVAIRLLRLDVYSGDSNPGLVERAAARQIFAAVVVAILGWFAGAGLTDAGRLGGVAAAAFGLAHLGSDTLPASPAHRALLVLLAGGAFAATWGLTTVALAQLDPDASVRRLLIGGAPVAVMLLVPGGVIRRGITRR